MRHELDNIDNTGVVPKNKQTLTMRLGLDCLQQERQADIFPEVAERIERITLKEMQDYLFPSGIMKVFPLNTLDDLGRLAEAALQRLESDSESKEARAILEAVALQFKDRSFVRAYEFISVIENFSSEVINEVMENFLEKKIKEKLFSAIFNFDRSQDWAISILSKYPRIYEAYQIYASEYQQRQEQEGRNNAEKEQKQRQEKANAAIDQLIDDLNGLIGEEGYRLMRSITPSLFLDQENWSEPPISLYI